MNDDNDETFLERAFYASIGTLAALTLFAAFTFGMWRELFFG